MRIKHFLIIILINLSNLCIAKTTQFIVIHPTHNGTKLNTEQLNLTRVTLFANERSDSLVLPIFNSCFKVKTPLARYNDQFILVDKTIRFDEIRIENPEFVSSFFPLNKTTILTDSIDQFNKRHHIFIYESTCDLEVECEDETADFYYRTNQKYAGGNYYRNHLAVLLIDTLDSTALSDFKIRHEISISRIENSGKLFLAKLNKGQVKDGKNKIIKQLLMDTLFVRDAGVLVDTNELQFISSFAKIHSMPMDEIEGLGYKGISQLKSMIKETNYATTHELEWGSGLYQRKTGLGYKIIEEQQKIRSESIADRCPIQEKLKDYDLEYLKLQTYNLSSSGGEDRGRKKHSNVDRMIEIKEKEKELFALFNAHLSHLEIVVVQQDYSSWPSSQEEESEENCEE